MPSLNPSQRRIDIGLDDSSLRLQAQAIDNLYYDPARQRQRNEIHVDAAQSAFCQGASSRLDEWTLQGTEIRELVVPDLDDGFAPPPQTWTTDFDPDDDSPTAEIAHLPTPVLPLVGGASSSRSLHPSPLFFENQLIHSWIRRHQRDPPMPMLGDPELGLNKSQTQAVAMALGEKLSLIQGVRSPCPLAPPPLTPSLFAASRNRQISNDRLHHLPPQVPLPNPSANPPRSPDARLSRSPPHPPRQRRPQPPPLRQSREGPPRAGEVDDREAARATPDVEQGRGSEGGGGGESQGLARVEGACPCAGEEGGEGEAAAASVFLLGRGENGAELTGLGAQ